MTELDRNILINSRVGVLLKPRRTELWPYFTTDLKVKKLINSGTFVCVGEDYSWFVICGRLYEYAKTLSRGNV